MRFCPEKQGTPYSVVQLTLDAFHEGDYERAVKCCAGFKVEGEITPTYSFFRGALLMQVGEFGESETWLRENIGLERSPQLVAIGFSSLAQLMIRLGRLDEALEYSKAGLLHRAGKGGLHRDMAETLLRRGASPTQALDLARLAVAEEMRPESSAAGVGDLNQGENLATLAWAVVKANRLVTEAVFQVGSQSATTTAQVHLYSGLAYIELGDRNESLEHFRAAAAVDPRGLWGRDAKAIVESQTCQ
jgi:tetratricopeptide (TPR) repeat protein